MTLLSIIRDCKSQLPLLQHFLTIALNTLPVSQTIAQQRSGSVAVRMELAVVLVPAVAFDKALPKQPES